MVFLDRLLNRIESLWMYIAAVALFVMMMVTVIDVMLRYIWNSPLGWSQEVITLYLLATAFFLALSDTLARNAHIRVDVVNQFLSPRTKTLFAIIVYAMSFVLFALIFWEGVLITRSAWVSGETYIGYVQWPMWLAKLTVPLGIALLELRIAYRFLYACKAYLGKDYEAVEQMEHEDSDVRGEATHQ